MFLITLMKDEPDQFFLLANEKNKFKMDFLQVFSASNR